ncbi:MAG: metallophosphoesterase, partial [Planctomycetota bacterium]
MTQRSTASSATLVAIGDLHGRWRPADQAYLEHAQPDLALFVGDLSDTEEAAMVEKIAAVDVPKAVILGNHDAWRSIRDR